MKVFLANMFFMYAVLTFIPVIAGRNILPFLVFAALITGWFLTNLKNRRIRRALTVSAAAYSLGAYLLISWVLPRYGRFFYWPLPSSYYLRASYCPYQPKKGYKILFPLSWPLDIPARPGEALGSIRESENLRLIAKALEEERDVEVYLKSSVLMRRWGHTDLWTRLAVMYYFQDEIYSGCLKVRKVVEEEWPPDNGHFLRIFVDGEEVEVPGMPVRE